MKWLFGKKKTPAPLLPVAPPPPITSIVVTKNLYDSTDPHDLPYSVVMYVNQLLHEGFYERDELPKEALWSYNVDYYLAQVNNGGHGQFIGNSRWVEPIVMDIQDGLEAMGHDEALDIFRDLMRFAATEPARFAQAGEGGGFGDIDTVIADLDRRFFAGPTSTIAPANGAWLRTLSNLAVLSDKDRDTEIARMISANTAAAARRAERQRLAREAHDRDPLGQAFEHLLSLARPRRTYQGWTAGFPREQEGGGIAHFFGVQTDAGIVQAIFAEGHAELRDGLVGPTIVHTSMAKLDSAVLKKTGRTLSEVLSPD